MDKASVAILSHPTQTTGDLAITAKVAAIYCDDEIPVAVLRSLVDGIEALVVTQGPLIAAAPSV
jgi:hypothetical protein